MISLNTQVEEKARQKDELADLDDVKKIYRGYTDKELTIAFNVVVNKEHWKFVGNLEKSIGLEMEQVGKQLQDNCNYRFKQRMSTINNWMDRV